MAPQFKTNRPWQFIMASCWSQSYTVGRNDGVAQTRPIRELWRASREID